MVASAASASCITLVDIVGFAVRRLHQSRRCGLRVAVAASAVVSFAGGGCISLAVVSFGQRKTKERISRSRRGGTKKKRGRGPQAGAGGGEQQALARTSRCDLRTTLEPLADRGVATLALRLARPVRGSHAPCEARRRRACDEACDRAHGPCDRAPVLAWPSRAG